ncbi:class I SAM-dependent methyltransferase [Anaeroselena agilis]|uniref:Class I SAM-dependent methyltransferase n=1 Tax=Anaeroselena agilis TaxID=3063788 RepID=A0ABU3NW79_9FIRM|nr:class I SAM-dependent methyltransferase [Selenomonadales bacterium 4137-cl]
MTIANALSMARQLLQDKLSAARTVVDATAGNGRDTLFLAANTPADAVVWAFDLQQEALDATARRLTEHGMTGKCHLIRDCHSRVADYVTGPIDAAMFNLGYRPGGDHGFTTRAETTVAALGSITSLLATGGIVTIVAYPGHGAGEQENTAVADFLAALPQAVFTAAAWRMLNQRNRPPILYIIGKKGSESV